MAHTHLTNPTVVGPGIWTLFHINSAQAKTIEDKKHAIWVIRATQKKFTCGECKGHFGKYLEQHPPEVTLDDDSESLFRWVWTFHNVVNARLGKAQVSYEQAKDLFWSEDSIYCAADCGSTHTTPEITIRPKESHSEPVRKTGASFVLVPVKTR